MILGIVTPSANGDIRHPQGVCQGFPAPREIIDDIPGQLLHPINLIFQRERGEFFGFGHSWLPVLNLARKYPLQRDFCYLR